MLLPTIPLLLSLLVSTGAQTFPRRPQARTYDTHAYYTLELSPSSPLHLAETIASSLGIELVEPLGELPGHYLLRSSHSPTPHHDHHSLTSRSLPDPIIQRWSNLPQSRSLTHTRSLTPLTLRKRAKRAHPPLSHPSHARRDDTEFIHAQTNLGILDPMLDQQWHLINQELPSIELNVTSLWTRGITGTGVKVVIVDDGLDFNSQDLHDNFYAEGSWDFNDHTELPLPRLSDDQHGTRCAGEIAAVKNDVCGVGVAYESKIAGVRILSAPISDADEAAALNYGYQVNDIYSCSWGPPDDGKSMEAPDGLILKAMVNGVQNGRAGKGSVFVFAAGNGGGVDDQCNFDGYTNSIFSITVGAVDRKGLHPYYSELCAAMMMVAPSSGSGDHIHTTDVGENKCAHTHGGTSAAAPLAAGVFALALQARPDLTWRDLQHIAVQSSVYFNPDDPDWDKTAAGRMFSYKYGYGRINAGAFVELAESWKLVKPQAWFDSPAVYLENDYIETMRRTRQVAGEHMPGTEDEGNDDSDSEGESNPAPVVTPSGTLITEEGISSTYEVTQEMMEDSNLEELEHITVRIWIDHQRRGDVEVEVKSPGVVTSVLARIRRFDDADTGYPGWKFMSLKHWDENPVGTWEIKVTDRVNPDKVGRFIAWSLQLWGQTIDPSLAKVWAPAEEGQPDEEQTGSDQTATVSQKPKPTAHLPGDHGEASGEADQPGLGEPTSLPSAGDQGDGDGEEDIEIPLGDEEGGVDEGWFDGIEGLGGQSNWLAGAGAIVLLSGGAVAAFFILRARRKRRNLFGLTGGGEGARGGYAPVDENVPMGLLERGRRKLGGRGGMGGGAAGTKDLYDAFGDGPSDESDDGLDERAGLRYHDGFLGDEDDEERRDQPPSYRDDDAPETRKDGSGTGRNTPRGMEGGQHSGSGSSGSWQDAAEDVART